LKNVKSILIVLSVVVLLTLVVSFTLGNWSRITGIYPYLKKIYFIILIVFISVKTLSMFEMTKKISGILKITAISCGAVTVTIAVLMFMWYNFLFFPDDEEYLKKKSDSVSYSGGGVERVEYDLIRNLKKSNISSPLTASDRKFLLKPEFKAQDINIDINPYGTVSDNNLKYATGKTFYYIYQKNCVVIKKNSSIRWKLNGSSNKRFLELAAVLPDLLKSKKQFGGRITVSFKGEGGSEKNILEKDILSEVKPDIEAFRFSNVLKAIVFYIKNPGRSVITDDTGWSDLRVSLPSGKGELEIKFQSSAKGNVYLFAGTPRIYTVENDKQKKHMNIVYIIFDTLGQPHIDLYEYYKIFKEKGYNAAIKEIGEDNIRTPEIDRYGDSSILFYNMTTEGQTTRPSISSLWTSQIYTKLRMPTFRNIVSMNDQQKFYDKKFTSLGEKLSEHGYLTKQIACNAQGHGVSGVGVDLGFDENHDYTMETSEYPANIKHIVNFLEKNQKRKFFLYTHLNVPHTPKWIPAKYFIRELWGGHFDKNAAKIRGNIRYADFQFKIIMDTLKKLKLDKNTLVVLTADHSMGDPAFFRDKPSRQTLAAMRNHREGQTVATFHPNAIYGRNGGQHLYSDYMKIPFMVIPPKGTVKTMKRNETYISTLDVAPTFLDMTTGQSEKKFSGVSFKDLIKNPASDKKYTHDLIPMVGRFMRGFIVDGRYKYWWNIKGIYKYDQIKGKKYIKQPEHLYDLKKDYFGTINLVKNPGYAEILGQMRKIRMEKFRDYDEINFVRIPEKLGKGEKIKIEIKSIDGQIVYPDKLGKNISWKRISSKEVVVNASGIDKKRIFSFETKPNRSKLKVTIFSNGKVVRSPKINIGVEKIYPFGSIISLNKPADYFVSRITGMTGYENYDSSDGNFHYYRVPVNYWLEMNGETKDINLSPGIKEVLRGWGYIQ